MSYQNQHGAWTIFVSRQESYQNQPSGILFYGLQWSYWWNQLSSSASDWAGFSLGIQGTVKSTEDLGWCHGCWWVWPATFLNCIFLRWAWHQGLPYQRFQLFDWASTEVQTAYHTDDTPWIEKSDINAWYGVPTGACEIPTTLFSVVIAGLAQSKLTFPLWAPWWLVRQTIHFLYSLVLEPR